MDWTRAIDGYCERLGPQYWAEPINAVTNLAFIIAALVVWPRTKGEPLARLLAGVLAVIGVASWLFHTHAQVWAAAADSLSILAYILIYIFAINRHAWGLSPMAATFATTLVFPYTAAILPLIQMQPFLSISAGYWPIPLLIVIYAIALRRRDAVLAQGLAIGAGILVVSLVFRSVDELICEHVPVGTHFMWHILNAIMLAWMIDVFVRLRRRQSAA